MVTKIKIPKLSANVDEVTITRWLKAEGEAVARGEALAELTTDKAAFELESPAKGHVRRIFAREKSVLPVGYIIALVGPEGSDLPDVSALNRKALAGLRGEQPRRAPVSGRRQGQSSSRGAPRATPAARRLAREKGVDLRTLALRAPGGLVNEKMVLDHLRKHAGSGGGGTSSP